MLQLNWKAAHRLMSERITPPLTDDTFRDVVGDFFLPIRLLAVLFTHPETLVDKYTPR